MVDQLSRPKDQLEVYWFSEQAQGYVSDGQLEQFESGRLAVPNRHFDPAKAHNPVGGVTYIEASACAKWMGRRLPSETEWTRAARGEKGDVTFVWGEARTQPRSHPPPTTPPTTAAPASSQTPSPQYSAPQLLYSHQPRCRGGRRI